MSSSISKQVSASSTEDLDLHDISSLLQSLSGRCQTLQSSYVTVEMLQKMKSEMEESLLKKLSLKNKRLKELEKKCDDLRLTFHGLQDDLKVCHESITSLRIGLDERTTKHEAELMLAKCTEKIDNASSELLRGQKRLEERNTGLLRTLSDDTEEKITKWKLKQNIHGVELERLKEVVEKLSGCPQSLSKSKDQHDRGGISVSPPEKNSTASAPTRSSPTSSKERPATIESVPISKPALSSPVPHESPSTSGASPSTMKPKADPLLLELIGTQPINSISTTSLPLPTPLKHGPLQPFGLSCLCGKRFTSRGNLSNHIRRFTTGPKFTCPICQKPFYSRVLLRNHVKNVRCILADEKANRFPVRGVQKRKLGRSGGQGSNKSNQPTKYANASNFNQGNDTKKRHGKAQKSAGEPYLPISCLCGEKFDSVAGFSNHLEHFESYSKLRFSCFLCSKRFPTKKGVAEHIKSFHEKLPTPNAAHQPHNIGNLNDLTSSTAQAHATPSSSKSSQNSKMGSKHLEDKSRRLHCICGLHFLTERGLRKHVTYQNRLAQPSSPSQSRENRISQQSVNSKIKLQIKFFTSQRKLNK